MTIAIRLIRTLVPVEVILIFIPALSVADLYKCTRVVDGDTIKVSSNGTKSTIRLVGIDAPEKSRKKHEPGQPFSQKATKYLAGLVSLIKWFGSSRTGRTGMAVFSVWSMKMARM